MVERVVHWFDLSALTAVRERRVSKARMGIGGAGMYNTVTFPRVDDVPPILQKRAAVADLLQAYSEARQDPRRAGKVDVAALRRREGLEQPGGAAGAKRDGPLLCAVTGRPARYLDPRTGRGYSDKASFKEVRRRFGGGKTTSAVDRFNDRAKS